MENEGEGDNWDDDEDEVELVSKYSERSLIKTKDFAIWSADEIEGRQKKIIEEVSDLFGLSEDEAITALKHFNWNPERLQEQWLDNEAKTRSLCGLTPIKFLVSRNMDKQDMCYICYKKLVKDE